MPTSCYTIISSARELFPKPTSNFAGEQSWFRIGEPVFSKTHVHDIFCSLGTLEQNQAAQPGLQKPSRILLIGLMGSDQEKHL